LTGLAIVGISNTVMIAFQALLQHMQRGTRISSMADLKFKAPSHHLLTTDLGINPIANWADGCIKMKALLIT
jgi:hypothetical protein